MPIIFYTIHGNTVLIKIIIKKQNNSYNETDSTKQLVIWRIYHMLYNCTPSPNEFIYMYISCI